MPHRLAAGPQLRHTPSVPRHAQHLDERPRRRPHGRLAAAAFVGAIAGLLALPGPGPTGQVVDLVGTDGAAAVGREPAPTGGPPPVVAPLAPAAAPQLPAAATPLPWAAAPLPSAAAPLAERLPAAAPALLEIENNDVPKLRYGESWGLRAPPLEDLVGYAWPIAHPRLTLPFGPSVWGSRMVDGERFHDGVDLATFCGDRILAAHSGKVLAAGRHYDEHMGWIGDLGPYLRRLDQGSLWASLPIVVVIDDGNGYRSVYAHFGKVTVKRGQVVKAGQLLGYEGATGRASGCHLHYGLFSPWELATMAIRPDVAKRMKLPKEEIARVDPLLVLPPKAGINAPKTPKSPKPSQPAPTPAPAPVPVSAR
jgi:murein DD-endopeptidase MepM/ murein hydrolase activator NlpD